MTAEASAPVAEASQQKPRRFRNPADGRLRAGWRILAFLGIFYAITLPLLFGLRALVGFAKSSPLVIVIIAAAATPAVYIARRWIDGKSFISLGLQPGRQGAADAVFGFLLSGAMAGAIFGAMWFSGFVETVTLSPFGIDALSALVAALLIMTLVGYWEELVFRGYLLQNMSEGMGLIPAVAVSCVLYGVVHALNPNAGLLSTAIIVLFGFLRIYGYLATGQLWLSMGMHTGWNFFQATVFGFAASGHAEDWTLITHASNAADWLSGGAFGPEGSILTIPVVLIVLWLMRLWTTRHGMARETAILR